MFGYDLFLATNEVQLSIECIFVVKLPHGRISIMLKWLVVEEDAITGFARCFSFELQEY